MVGVCATVERSVLSVLYPVLECGWYKIDATFVGKGR
jgi:hypothetical protein